MPDADSVNFPNQVREYLRMAQTWGKAAVICRFFSEAPIFNPVASADFKGVANFFPYVGYLQKDDPLSRGEPIGAP